MKKTLLSLFAMASVSMAIAQTHTVSFAVGIPNTVTGLDSVDVTGNFLEASGLPTGSNWSKGIKLSLNGGVYTGTVNLPDGSYEAKFRTYANGGGASWEGVPNGCATNGNRGITVAGANVNVGPYCLSTCDPACSNYVPITVHFMCDFAGAPSVPANTMTSGTPPVAVNSVHNFTGNMGADAGFSDWTPGSIAMSQVGTSTVWEKTVPMYNKVYQGKFLVADQWNAPDPADPTTTLQFSEQGPAFNNASCLSDTAPTNFTNRVFDFSHVPANATIIYETAWQSCSVTITGTRQVFNMTYFSAQPNPMTDATTLNFSNDAHQPLTISIANATGQIVKQFNNVTSNTLTVSRDNMPAGMYFVSLISNGKVYTFKLAAE